MQDTLKVIWKISGEIENEAGNVGLVVHEDKTKYRIVLTLKS